VIISAAAPAQNAIRKGSPWHLARWRSVFAFTEEGVRSGRSGVILAGRIDPAMRPESLSSLRFFRSARRTAAL